MRVFEQSKSSSMVLVRVTLAIAVAFLVIQATAVFGSGSGKGNDRGGQNPPDAPAAFDGLTNGHISQTQFDLDLKIFAEQEEIDEGLGPLFNSRACGECHSNPITGGVSQITEMRAGRYDGRRFLEHAGGSLVHSRAIDPVIQERVDSTDNVRTFRTSLNVLGDGFVEAIADSTLEDIAAHQSSDVRGTIIRVPVLESKGVLRIGRFGWKDQHASLVSFSADAYLNEMGITSPLAPTENTSSGVSVDEFDDVPDPEEAPTPQEPVGPDIEAFTRFMRATKPPPRDLQSGSPNDIDQGEKIFVDTGCATCHTMSIVTAPTGTVINGGKFSVPAALGDRTIHPFSDFLLHDVGTGDGVVQNGGDATRNKIRTAPLWGLRTHSVFMHDGMSVTIKDAIMRHKGQAAKAVARFNKLVDSKKRQLLAFLNSL